ncbi:hypothetical protein [Streptomyces sp. NPDC048272]|uniref:hypothetical protein n=1 Tax=Streptomyces sp. NPDC048272 TaxID=3154616 RepID=UPI00342C210B
MPIGSLHAGGTETHEGCTVTWNTGTPFEGVSLRLSNGTSGPVARLIGAKTARTLTTLTTTDRTGLAGGARIKDSDDPKTPQFQMRVIGGQIPWEGVSFPKPPKDCAAEPTAKPTATAKPTPAAKPAVATKAAPLGLHSRALHPQRRADLGTAQGRCRGRRRDRAGELR